VAIVVDADGNRFDLRGIASNIAVAESSNSTVDV